MPLGNYVKILEDSSLFVYFIMLASLFNMYAHVSPSYIVKTGLCCGLQSL